MAKGDQENQHHQIIIFPDLLALKFNDFLTVDSLDLLSNSEWRFNECKIEFDVSSWDKIKRLSKELHSWKVGPSESYNAGLHLRPPL